MHQPIYYSAKVLPKAKKKIMLHSSRIRNLRLFKVSGSRVGLPSWGWGLPTEGVCLLGGLPHEGVCLPHGIVGKHTPPVDRMTHARENITFPQLRWRAVIKLMCLANSFSMMQYEISTIVCGYT